MKYKNKTVAPIYLNGELTKYVVTKKGRVFNTKTGKELKLKIDTKGYYKVTISHKNIQKDKRVHVLVAEGFVTNPNPNKFKIVNHLDGNKLNPYYKNLEWTDHAGNIRHAIDHNLINFANGENSGRSILTENQVHEICKIMEAGTMSQREISKKFNVHEQVIHEIKLGNNWKHISKKYNIQNCKLDWKATNQKVVEKICKEIVKNKLTLREISKKYDIKYEIVLDIINKKTFTSISNKYDFSNYNKKQSYDNKIIDSLHRLIRDGKTNKEIISILNLEKGPKTNTLLSRHRKKYK